MKSVRNCVEVIIVLIVLGAATFSQRVFIADWIRQQMQPALPPALDHQEVLSAEIADEPQETIETPQILPTETEIPPEDQVIEAVAVLDEEVINEIEQSGLPASFNLAVPFTSQAPYGVWSEPYKEACEEASLYMVHAYYEALGAGPIEVKMADDALLKIVAFEKQLFGYYEDTTVQQTGLIAEMFYGYEKVEMIENPTVEQIKTHVVAGRPVIIPLAGREIGNPYFTAPGPIYHMLVIRGYTKDGKFITNDPGTKHGEAYLYDFDILLNATHDWNNGEDIDGGKSVVLVVYPNE